MLVGATSRERAVVVPDTPNLISGRGLRLVEVVADTGVSTRSMADRLGRLASVLLTPAPERL